MRLLNASTKKLELLHDRPPYAIVSHRWGAESDEVLYTDITDGPSCIRNKAKGYEKVVGACSRALHDGLAYVWLDTCCIDKRNEKELTTAINSMYGWYQDSEVCYVYLHDVSNVSEITKSEWFLRGWTLQELIAPQTVKFFTKDWTLLGTREELINLITDCTGIKPEILVSSTNAHNVSIAQRMHWAAKRITTEEEDRAYSLLGLFDIHLPAIYGIKHKAFKELQHRIVSKFPDKSLFAWRYVSNGLVDCGSPPSITGLLATSPSEYLNAYEIPCEQFYRPFGPNRLSRWECFSLKNGAVCVTLPIRQAEDPSVYEALLRCSLDPPQDPPQSQRPLVVYLKQDDKYGRFVRTHVPTSLRPLQNDSVASFTLEKVHVEEVSNFAARNPPSRAITPNPLSPLPDSSPAPTSSVVGSDERIASVHQNEPASEATPAAILHGHTFLLRDPGVFPTPRAAEGPWNDTTNNSEKVPSDEITPIFGASDIEDSTVIPPFRRLLIRHPPGTKTTNVIVCGEPGAGAGGVVNLIVGRDVVDPQTEFKCDAMTFTVHDITIDSRNMRMFYAIGPQDHRLDVKGYHTAVENAIKFAQSLCNDGGIHLLLFCTLRTKLNRNIHRLFYETVCGQSVPTVVLVTGFASTGKSLEVDPTGIRCDDHVGISVVRPRSAGKSGDYERSVETVKSLLVKYTAGSREAYLPCVGPSMHLILKEFMSASAKRALMFQVSIEAMQGSSVGLTMGLGGRLGFPNDLALHMVRRSIVHNLVRLTC